MSNTLGDQVQAAAGVNQQINFQGRLLNGQGAVVPDGFYNIQFKVYQDGDGQTAGNTTGSPVGTLKWTENYLNVNGQGVRVVNGFVSVQLGAVNPFGSNVDWNQDTLWLSMNIANTNPSCASFVACSPDGEMVPMKRLSSSVYALNSGMLGGLTSSDFIQNTTSPQTANFNVTGNGVVGGTLGITGLVTATGGLTASGSSINLNNNSNFTVNIATGTSTGLVSIGGGAGTFALDTTNIDISASGAITGATGITLTSGNITTTATVQSATVNATTGYQVNSVNGSSTTCSGGQFLQNAVVAGGITTGGTCVAASNGVTTVGAIDSQTKSADGAVIIGTNVYFQTADATSLGLVSFTNQTFAGLKTFNSGVNLATGQALQINGVTTLNAGGLTFSSAATATIQSAAAQALNITGNAASTVNTTAGALTLNGFAGTNVQTNGVTRATFDTANNVYFGNGATAAAPNNFVIRGTGSSVSGVAGGTLSVQGGSATTGNANGGNLNLSGGTGFGTGVSGLVVVNTPTFLTAGSQGCATSCTITQANVDGNGVVVVSATGNNVVANLPNPTIAGTVSYGRIVYVTAANGSNEFTLSVNGGGNGNMIAMRQNTTATMIWGSGGWTAAGASSSTTLQSAYDNTLQSAGGAELIVSKTGTTNGLTIRDSSTAPVDGTLLSVQTSSAAILLSVNSGVTEYSTNGGAEVLGLNAASFPTNTWTAASTSPNVVSRYTTAGNFVATGQASVSVATTLANHGVKNRLSTSLTANTNYNVSFATRLTAGTFTDMNVYYSVDGTANSVTCKLNQAVATSVWTKVNCTFAAPSAGITANNAIIIRQGNAGARTFYVENLSVTIAADYNYATDGSVNDDTNFGTNWSFVNAGTGVGSVTRNVADGFDASDSASVTLTTGAANAGLRNRLAINPLQSTLYRITTYAKLGAGTFNDFKIRYSPVGSTAAAGTYIDCVDYNTQTLTLTAWTKVTCYINTDATTVTTPYINFVETTATARTFAVDAFSMTIASDAVPNVQVGGGVLGGPTTLFTLDKGASAPIASNNDALLGSMYYDTSLGKLQCYEADGWGACGSSPDSVVTISPEYTNAVMHGTGVGTMTSDLCSDTLNINDGSSSQPTICGTNETYNFYKWTSPQPSAQTYGIYVTYQLPSTFKEFASGQTSLMGRTDSTNATVTYQVYRSTASGLNACGAAVTVSTGVQTSWQTAIASGVADPSTCGFLPGESIVFRINATASATANAYVGNLNFTFSNR